MHKICAMVPGRDPFSLFLNNLSTFYSEYSCLLSLMQCSISVYLCSYLQRLDLRIQVVVLYFLMSIEQVILVEIVYCFQIQYDVIKFAILQYFWTNIIMSCSLSIFEIVCHFSILFESKSCRIVYLRQYIMQFIQIQIEICIN